MKLLRSIVACVNKPLPGWITIMLLSAGVALASVPVLNASLSVPSGGTITDSNASPSTCVGVNGSKQFVYGTNCSTSGGGDTITSPNSTLSVGGTSAATTLDLNLGTANAWTGLQSFNGSSASSQSGAPTTVYGSYYGLGNGTTNNVAIAIGWQTGTSGWPCVSACTTSNSAQLCFYAMSSTGPVNQCPFVDSAAVFNIGKVKITSSLTMGANPLSGASKIGTNTSCSGTSPVTGSNNSMACRVTAASSSAVFTFSSAYAAAPVCTATDETTVTSAVKVAVTTTAVTATTPGASDVVDILCIGNGGV